MTLNKKILAAAIVGGLFATAAQAQVVISGTTGNPVSIASEVVINSTAGTAFTNTGALNIVTNTGYSFSGGEVRYVRIECSPNVIFAQNTSATVTNSAGGITGPSIGAINGRGTNAISFSITADPASGLPATVNDSATPPVAQPTRINILGDRLLTSNAPATCTYGLYDQPSQAAQGGTAGRIATFSNSYLTSASSYLLTVIAEGATADVEATPSYANFVSTNVAGDSIANLGQVYFNTRQGVTSVTGLGPAQAQPIGISGTGTSLAALLDANSTHTITGDFSQAANANGTFTGAALNRVYFATAASCTTAGSIPATTVSATSATFRTGAAAVPGLYLCYAPRTAGSAAIPTSSYVQNFTAVSSNPTAFSVANVGPRAHGDIVRNGTSLQAQLVQVPAGWTSRIVLTNTGSVARPYTIAAQTEAGISAAAGSAATGTIPANGTIVLNTADIVTFTGGLPRGTLNVTVAGPDKQIQGLYQIVNGATGSIANTALVRPGTN